MKIRDRIRELRRVKSSDLIPNPRNWRTHPEEQANALRSVLADVGIADALLARETPAGLMLIDGHLRADTDPSIEWPVLVLDVTEEEANRLLATIDPIAEMAEVDEAALASLLAEIDIQSEELRRILDDKSASYEAEEVAAPELPSGDKPPFQQMTFTLHDDQAEAVKQAIEAAKKAGPFVDAGNENSNGNALARIAEAYLG
jgi:hypothetical protein